MISPSLIRLLGTTLVGLGYLACAEMAAAQLGTRPSTSPPAAGTASGSGGTTGSTGALGSGGSRFAPPPPTSGTDRLTPPSSRIPTTGGTIGSTSSGLGSSVGGTSGSGLSGASGIPSTPGAGGSGGVYGGTVPSTGSTGTAPSESPLGGGSRFGSGSSSSSTLGSPSTIIPRTPPTSAPGSSASPSGGYPYDTTDPSPATDRSSDSSADDAPAIGSRSGDAVGMNGIETKGYALIGPVGHHYIFGNLAVADYIDRGQRRIVTLELETNLPKDDRNFLYYRELRDGNRWAFATKAGPDRRFAVYFQAAGATGDARSKWRRLQRAQLQWNRATPAMSEEFAFE